MRFFEHQNAARRQTHRLLAGFALALLATGAGAHLALALLWQLLSLLLAGGLPFPAYVFSANVGVTLLLALGGWWIETSNRHRPDAAMRMARAKPSLRCRTPSSGCATSSTRSARPDNAGCRLHQQY